MTENQIKYVCNYIQNTLRIREKKIQFPVSGIMRARARPNKFQIYVDLE